MKHHYFERMQEKLDALKETGRLDPSCSEGSNAQNLDSRNLQGNAENPDKRVPPPTA